jgi:hypothetical protein
MSNEPRTARQRTIVCLFGIAVVAALFLAGTRDEPAAESPFQRAAHHLRIGMTVEEVRAVTALPRPGVYTTVACDYGSQWVDYSDHKCRESLSLSFVDGGLVKWELLRW